MCWARGKEFLINHALVVVGVREPRLGHGFRHVDAEPVFAWDGRRRRLSGRNESCRRMVPGERTLASYGHHECRYRYRRRDCSAVHRRVAVVATWRWVFFLCRRRRPRLVGLVVAGLSRTPAPPPAERARSNRLQTSWFQLFSFPEVWGLVGAKFLSDAAWYFYLFWVPKYLYDVRGFDMKRLAICLDSVCGGRCRDVCSGGWFSGWLIRRGRSLNFSRKTGARLQRRRHAIGCAGQLCARGACHCAAQPRFLSGNNPGLRL